MRSSLIGQTTLRFDALPGIGPHPRDGAVVESIRRERRRLFIEWDDGIILETGLRFSGVWHLYRSDAHWTKPMSEARAVIEVPGWIAVCFGPIDIETYRAPDQHRHPQCGGVGPDVRSPRLDVITLVDRMIDYSDPNASIAEVLGDPRVITGVGNVDRSEILWAVELDPRTEFGELTEDDCETLVEVAQIVTTSGLVDLNAYGRVGQMCTRCHGTIAHTKVALDPRPIYWCPDCQKDPGEGLVLPLHLQRVEAHPAEVLYLNDARAARERIRIVDDARRLG